MGTVSTKISKEGVESLSDASDAAAKKLAQVYESASQTYNSVTGGGETQKGAKKAVFTPAGSGMPVVPQEVPEE